MTANELVDPRSTPGPDYVWATDDYGFKKWIRATVLVGEAAPHTMAFLVSASTWTWTHNLGHRPIVRAYDTSWNEIIMDIVHDSVNQVRAVANGNVTGYLLGR